MKGKDIKLNEEYAVTFPVRGLPKNRSVVRRSVAIDRRSNNKFVVSYDAMVPDNKGAFPGNTVVVAQFVDRTLRWRKGHREAVVDGSAFIAPWCDWTPAGVQDGRVAAAQPRTTVVDGVAYTEHELVA